MRLVITSKKKYEDAPAFGRTTDLVTPYIFKANWKKNIYNDMGGVLLDAY
jgi:hypothetical protein